MKKLVLTLVLIITVSEASNAQFTKVGGGLTYGTGFYYNNAKDEWDADLHRSPFLGLFVTGIYELNLPFHLAPSFTYFLPRTNTLSQGSPEEARVSTMMFDVNGHYVFNSLDKFEFYGLAGCNITLAKIKRLYPSTTGDSDNALGLNLGVGTYMKMTEQFDLYGEAKYIISKYDQFIVNVGILINIDWLKKNENSEI